MLPGITLTKEEEFLISKHYKKPVCEGVQPRAHTVLLFYKGYTPVQIADILFQSEQTVCSWIKAFSKERIASLFPKYLDNQNASKLTREQKKEIKDVLSKPPSAYGIPKEFWDISSLKKYIYAEFGIEYESDESYRLIFKLHNYSFHVPGTFDIHRDEKQIEKRMFEIAEETESLMKDKHWMVLAADEARIQWETEIRRAWLPKGRKTIIQVERKREAQSFLGLLNIQTGKELLYRLSWQNQEEIIKALEKLITHYPDKRICIIWDNARFHKGKKLRKKLSTTLKRIHLINLPPYAPDYNPQEHVWQYGKEKLSNNQRESLEETVETLEEIVTGRFYQYSF